MDNLTEEDYLISKTKVGDDIDMIVNLVDQLRDVIGDDLNEATAQVPDPTEHCKHWSEINLTELVSMLAVKYANAPRMKIPKEYETSF